MRRIASLFALGLVLASSEADAGYARVAHRGSFGAFLNQVASAARRSDMRAMRRLVDKEFTIGEELGREDSLATLAHDASMRRWLAATADHGGCYRTARNIVQCELPDPGPGLDHTKSRTSIAMFERTRRGWRLNAFFG